jgi:hypothetical protein
MSKYGNCFLTAMRPRGTGVPPVRFGVERKLFCIGELNLRITQLARAGRPCHQGRDQP